MPSTPVVGWRELPTTIRRRRRETSRLVGRHPCVVFGTVAPDGRRHAHRIYVAPTAPAKPSSALARMDVRAIRRSRPLRPRVRAPPAASCSGAIRRRRHTCCSRRVSRPRLPSRSHTRPRSRPARSLVPRPCRPAASGLRALAGDPRVTIAADRDEARPQDDRGFKAGEKAARAFALAHHERLEVRIALPGDPGEDVDWLDVLRRAGVEAVRIGIAGAQRFEPADGRRFGRRRR